MKGKEVKIGLSVIGVLLCVFGAVLFNRLSHRDDDPVAAKDGSKATEKKPQTTKKAVGNKTSPETGSKSSNDSKDGPSLKNGAATQRNSPSFSSRNNRSTETRDPWAVRNASTATGGRYQDVTLDQPGEAADRYGRIEGQANDDSQPDVPNGAFALEPVEPNAGDEMPAEGADASDGGPAFAGATDQPADGYQTVEEATDDPRAAEAADEDPFPSASRGGAVANRGLPSGLPIGGPLKSSADEVQLRPIEAAAEEPLQASHDAEIADADATDERMPPNFGSRSATGRNGRSGFSSVSRQTAAATEPTEPIDERALAEEKAGAIPQSDFGLPEDRAGGDGVYFVETNDTFASISKKVYGTEGYFKALHEYNRERFPNPNLIDPGDEVATPDVAVLEQNYPKLCPKRRNVPNEPAEGAMRLASNPRSARGGRTYLVREGDTLFDIAKHELGKANRWREIYDLNQGQLGEDFNYLSPGTELLLPGSGEKPDPVADRRYLDRSNRRR
jgi:nucleoid-associated protein YgaU